MFILQELQSGRVLLRLAHLYEVLTQLLFFDYNLFELKIRDPSFISDLTLAENTHKDNYIQESVACLNNDGGSD